MSLRDVRKDCVPTAPVTITINLSNQSVMEHSTEDKTVNVEVKQDTSSCSSSSSNPVVMCVPDSGIITGSSSTLTGKPQCINSVCCSSGNQDVFHKTDTTGVVMGQTEIYPCKNNDVSVAVGTVETSTHTNNNTCVGVVSSKDSAPAKKTEEPPVQLLVPEALPSCQCYTISKSQNVYFSSQQEKIRYHIQSMLELYGISQAKQIAEILGNETLLKEFLKQTPVTVYTNSKGEKCLNKDGTNVVHMTS